MARRLERDRSLSRGLWDGSKHDDPNTPRDHGGDKGVRYRTRDPLLRSYLPTSCYNVIKTANRFVGFRRNLA